MLLLSIVGRCYIGAGINFIGVLIATILLALVVTELEIMASIDPTIHLTTHTSHFIRP
jgi:hypothetical protein